MSAPPGHERGRPGEGSGPCNSFGDRTMLSQVAPVVVDGAPEQLVLDAGLTLDDLHAAFMAGCEYGRAENISGEADVEARRLLLEQSSEWRSATHALAMANHGPSWAAMMLEVIDGDESEVA